MPRKHIPNADTLYLTRRTATTFRPTIYLGSIGAGRPDDGIIDPIAVERYANGDTAIALSPREVVCVIAYLAARNRTDAQIAELFGRTDPMGKAWVSKTRNKNDIAASDTGLDMAGIEQRDAA